ncbi:hypothetical protein BJX70DRAFT_175331 [Aspergillus crustosus]
MAQAQLRVLIAGASIAGPTAAYWFAKAGAKVTVIERFPHLRTNGQNVDIRTAGVSVMRKMLGMEAAVRAKTIPLEGLSFVRDDGRPYGTLRATGNPEQQSLVSEYEILRGDLARILFDMTKDLENVSYVFDEQIVSIQQHEREDGPVMVEFMSTLATAEYDLVVACDGSASRTRSIGLGCAARDHIQPINAWTAYFTVPRDLLNGSMVAQSHSAPGGRTFFLASDPSGVTRVGVMCVLPGDNPEATEEFRKALKSGTEQLKTYVAVHYKGVGWKWDEIVPDMLNADDFYGSEIVQLKPPTLHKGRFVLVGNAGYAPGPTGGGTSLAMAGAYYLAGEISKHKDDLAAGLQGYEEKMRPLIKDLQTIPPLFPTAFAPQTAWGIWLRNMVFALVCWARGSGIVQKFSGGSFGHADQYKLPEYDWKLK